MNGYQKIEYIEPVYTTAFKHVHPVTRQEVAEGAVDEAGQVIPREKIDVSFPSGHKPLGIFAWMKVEDGICTAILDDNGQPMEHPSTEHRLVSGAFEMPAGFPPIEKKE